VSEGLAARRGKVVAFTATAIATAVKSLPAASDPD